MVQENMEKPEDNQEKQSSLFDKMAELRPARTDVAPFNADGSDTIESMAGSLTKRMQISPKLSDTQVVDRRLFPVLLEAVEWLNNMMVARVFPDTINPLRKIIVKHLLQEYEEMSMPEAICLAETALTIALDGEGRLDIIHMFSKLSESTEEEKNRLA